MLYYHTLCHAALEHPSSVALGFFDGLHLGHKAVIAKAVSAREKGLLPAVFTFRMDARGPEKKPALGYELITPEDKRMILAQWGVQAALCPDFSEFCAMEPEQFVQEILIQKLRASHVCCGRDFRFGRKAAAGIRELAALCKPFGVVVDPIEDVIVDGQRVSSTWIRSLLGQGNVKKAAALLGRPFGYDFQVTEGKHLGRKLDFPTINQPIPPQFVTPCKGVYASAAYVGEQWRPAVTNVGLRPTVEHSSALNSETYICGFSGDLYGKRVPVRLLEFLRPEQKFQSVEALQNQIRRDTAQAEKMAEEYLKQDFFKSASGFQNRK
ncbi:MAG: riboflavin biosynthesis protein RibF [Oscillospiraceae bacterium]|nr:riboflavin biosynthesis protein RibF [Oscillospiraceae bacterium]